MASCSGDFLTAHHEHLRTPPATILSPPSTQYTHARSSRPSAGTPNSQASRAPITPSYTSHSQRSLSSHQQYSPQGELQLDLGLESYGINQGYDSQSVLSPATASSRSRPRDHRYHPRSSSMSSSSVYSQQSYNNPSLGHARQQPSPLLPTAAPYVESPVFDRGQRLNHRIGSLGPRQSVEEIVGPAARASLMHSTLSGLSRSNTHAMPIPNAALREPVYIEAPKTVKHSYSQPSFVHGRDTFKPIHDAPPVPQYPASIYSATHHPYPAASHVQLPSHATYRPQPLPTAVFVQGSDIALHQNGRRTRKLSLSEYEAQYTRDAQGNMVITSQKLKFRKRKGSTFSNLVKRMF